MLTDIQIKDLAKRMAIPLERVCFKDQLTQKPLKYNRSYIINMENEYGEDGERNEGSHWVCFQVNKYKSGVKEGIYFDSFGQPPPEIIKTFTHSQLPHNTIDIQSLMDGTCGWYCLAFLHFINTSPCRCNHLYTDAEGFMSLFDDLNKSIDYKKNEFVLKHFFEPKEKSLRNPITV